MHSVKTESPGIVAPEGSQDWNTLVAQRTRTLLFLLFAAVYLAFHLVVPADYGGRGWVFEPLFNGDWYFFGGEPPPWYDFEFLYRWFLTMLPLMAWAAALYFLLTRFRVLTHRRVAFAVIMLGLVFLEGDMRWYQMSRKHVGWTELGAFFELDSADLGLRDSDYTTIYWQFGYHFLFLSLLAFLAGPEPRLCIQAIWNGPIGRTYFGMACKWFQQALIWLRLDALTFRLLGWLDSKAAFACIAALVMVDPVVIWALDKEKHDNQGERTVIRYIADANPLRMQSLDRTWNKVVYAYSQESQEVAAANAAMRDLDTITVARNGSVYSVAKPSAPAKPYNVLILQAETLSAEIFSETELPFISEFSKKCLRLNRHFSAANATHYGILGLLHGNPVTFFTGPRNPHRPNPYLDHFTEHGYKSRLISRSVMKHHKLGHYLPNWTEPISEPGGDFKVIPVIHEELAKEGPRLVYSFYHATHYPYNHSDEPRYQKYLPEVDYEFNYNRSDLLDYKDQIVNRYKNTLVELDDWCKDIITKVDLNNTIIVITGDHGEEFFQQGRLGHCSSLNIHQTMAPCFVYIPGVEPADISFVTSHSDIMPTIAEALGHQKRPESMGQSLFAPVSFRYAVVSHFEYTKCLIWAIATEDRMVHFERDYWDNVEVIGLTNWRGRPQNYRTTTAEWDDSLRIVRQVEGQLRATRD